jgi:selenium metabolism protein YedF
MAEGGALVRSGTVVVVNGETMGRGDDGLGAKLVASFLRTAATVDPKPDAIVFYNAAVKLLGPASESLEPLRALHAAGVDLLACVTCLEFFGLTQQLQVGEVSNMREIVRRTMEAGKVWTL